MPQLPEPFTISKLVPMLNKAGVDHAVTAPPSLSDWNNYGLEAVRRYPDRLAAMGRTILSRLNRA